MTDVLTIIPARMASSRLPGKPLADMDGLPMIVRVHEAGVRAGLGPVVTAAGEPEIADAVRAAGGEAVLTDPDLPSGTDRVHAAARGRGDVREDTIVINLQGDMPHIDPALLVTLAGLLRENPDADCATLAAPTDRPDAATNPHLVKAVIAGAPGVGGQGRALYFTRAACPHGPGPLWHHIGLYAYRFAALARFCALPPSSLELRESLEQLRALEAGMVMQVGVVARAPKGVDTPQDLAEAIAALREGPR